MLVSAAARIFGIRRPRPSLIVGGARMRRRFARERSFALLLAPLVFIHCWGAKTGLIETPAALVTFRPGVSPLPEIFENAVRPGFARRHDATRCRERDPSDRLEPGRTPPGLRSARADLRGRQRRPEPSHPDYGRPMSPSWTPDGSRVVFLRFRTGIDSRGNPSSTARCGRVADTGAGAGEAETSAASEHPAPRSPNVGCGFSPPTPSERAG